MRLIVRDAAFVGRSALKLLVWTNLTWLDLEKNSRECRYFERLHLDPYPKYVFVGFTHIAGI